MIIDDILKKKEMKNLDRGFVEKELEKYLKVNGIKEVPSERSGKYKKIVKELRKKLHDIYGVYKVKKGLDINELLNKIKNESDVKRISLEVLKLHTSTLERFDYYEEIYSKVLEGAESVCDLGCGFNPFSYVLMPNSIKKYFASDFNNYEVNLIYRYFGIIKMYNASFEGKVEVIDLRELDFKIPSYDVCFLFKVLDILEEKGHKKAEKLIRMIPAKRIIVSFPTKTLSGKRMRNVQRKWFEMMCLRIGYSVSNFEVGNELFYVIEK